VLNPALVFPLVWLAVVVISPLSVLDFPPYSERFYWYVLGAVGTFTLGVAFAWSLSHSFPHKLFHDLRGLAFQGRWVLYLYFGVMVFALYLQVQNRAELMGPEWWLPENIVKFRYFVTEEQAAQLYPWVSYLNFFFFSAIPVLICHRAPKTMWAVVGVLLLTYVYFSSARASIFTIALIAYFFDWQRNGFRFKLTATVGGILVAAYFAIAVLTGKTADEGAHFGLLAYALSPSHALDQILNGQWRWSDNVHTFKFAHSILHGWRVISDLNVGNDPFYWTPHPTNVYTIFGPYVLDFGVWGSLVWMLAIGMACGLLYYVAKHGDPYMVFLYALAISLLCLSMFHDHFTSSGYVWASIVLGFFFFPRVGKSD
jgi:oligosaccharide repeat unit polymerase